jgi:hypothetical protein
MGRSPYLPEFLRILNECQRLGIQEWHDQPTLVRVLSTNLLEGRFFDFSDVVWLTRMGLVEESDSGFRLSDLGHYVLQLGVTGDVYPTENQVSSFIECLFSGRGLLERTLSNFFLSFGVSPGGETFRARIADFRFESHERDIGELLAYLNVLSIQNGWYVVIPTYLDRVQGIRASARGMSPEDLEAILLRRREIGETAELMCLEFEKQRLVELGKPVHAKMVEHTGGIDISAGYDISSFDGVASSVEHDRFIEVKASTSSDFRFFWSGNEINTARKLGAKYWIYYLRDLRPSSDSNAVQPEMFQDPIMSIMDNPRFRLEEDSMHVREVRSI